MEMKKIGFQASRLGPGFWQERYETVRDVTVDAVRERFEETGRMASLALQWKPGDPNEPHIFWDSDVTKWIEAVAYLLQHNEIPELKAYVDRLINVMERSQDESGYLNTYFTVVEPENRFTKRVDHELYCAGHLVEAAIAYAEATGEKTLLAIARRYIDLIDEAFRVKQTAAFDTPGHQEIELALFKLYEYCAEPRYKALAEYFLNKRGHSGRDSTYEGYDLDHLQTHLPIREQKTAEGHAVRALYMFAAIVDMAILNQDEELRALCLDFYENVVNKRMYITGAVGSTYLGESFTYDYHLPSDTAYAETCASIALALFARRMWLMDPDGRYADTAEQAIYNTALAGLSLEGDAFFYENPLRADVKEHGFYSPRPHFLTKHLPIFSRAKVFSCSCCPPNISRFVASIADFIYSYDQQADRIYLHCYMSAKTRIERDSGPCIIRQETAYPYEGRVRLSFETDYSGELALRIPAWCPAYELSLNGSAVNARFDRERQFLMLSGPFAAGDEIVLDLEMRVRIVAAHPEVNALAGQVAVLRGPLVYCAEAVDNPDVNVLTISLDPETSFEENLVTISGRSIPMLRCRGLKPIHSDSLYQPYPRPMEQHDLCLIPYFAWANRGENDMTVWLTTG